MIFGSSESRGVRVYYHDRSLRGPAQWSMAADDKAVERGLHQFDSPKREAASGSRVSCLRELIFPRINFPGFDGEVRPRFWDLSLTTLRYRVLGQR